MQGGGEREQWPHGRPGAPAGSDACKWPCVGELLHVAVCGAAEMCEVLSCARDAEVARPDLIRCLQGWPAVREAALRCCMLAMELPYHLLHPHRLIVSLAMQSYASLAALCFALWPGRLKCQDGLDARPSCSSRNVFVEKVSRSFMGHSSAC